MISGALRRAALLLAPLLLAGCFQVSLNGPIAGATFTVTPLDQPDQVLFTALSTNPVSEAARLGEAEFLAQPPAIQVLSLGNVEFDLDVQPGRLYLVTASGGVESDNNRDFSIDAVPRQVRGQWRAIVRGDQLSLDFANVTALTEAFYQSVADSLEFLTATQIMERFDNLATRVIAEDLTQDGRINYEDVLRFSTMYHRGKLKKELGNLERLALAIQEGQDEESLSGLANRFLGGKATFGLDKTVNLKRDPDGTCDGRGAALVADVDLTVTTEPPSLDCSDSDRGGVAASLGQTAAQIELMADGKPRKISADSVEVSFSKYDVKANKLQVKYTQGGSSRQKKLPITAPRKLKSTTSAYQKMQSIIDQGGSRPASGDERVSGDTLQRVSRAASGFDAALVDANTYGTLVTSWTACLSTQMIADLEADGLTVPPFFRDWAVGGCTSPIAEVERWVDDTPTSQVDQVTQQIETLELDGCPNCYNFITIPRDGATYTQREIVFFNGVAPANARSVGWDFGDGVTTKRWSAQHAYPNVGTYTARFSVEYRNGNSGFSEVTLNIESSPFACFDEPTALAGPNLLVAPGTPIVINGGARANGPVPECSIVSYRWEYVAGPQVTLSGVDTPTVSFTAPLVMSLTRLLLRLTVTDSDGRTDIDDVTIDINPNLGAPPP